MVAKGGNLLLGVGPTPKGVIQPEVVAILKEIGQWLKVNGEGIYGTRNTPNYNSKNVWFTASKDGNKLYALYVPNEKEELPQSIEWENNIPVKNSAMVLLKTGKKVKWAQKGNKVIVNLPGALKTNKEPLVFSFKLQK